MVPIAIPLAFVAFCTAVLCLWTLGMSRGALRVVAGLGIWSASLALQTGGWLIWSAISLQAPPLPPGITAGNALLILGLAVQCHAIRRALGHSGGIFRIYGGYVLATGATMVYASLTDDARWRVLFGAVYVIMLLGHTAHVLWMSGPAGGLNHRFLSFFYGIVAVFFALRSVMIFIVPASQAWWLYSAHVVSVAFCLLSSFGFFAICNQLYAQRLRESEQSARENEVLLNFALESTVDAIWDFDYKTGSVTFSKHWEEMLGFSPGELENNLVSWEQRIHPDDLILLNEVFWQYSIGKIPEYECNQRIRAKNGEYIWIKDRGIIVSRDAGGNPLRFIGTMKNIDAQMRQAAESRRNQDLFEQVFSRTPVGISLITPEGIPIRQNPAVMQMYGFSDEDIRAKKYRERVLYDSTGRVKPHDTLPHRKALMAPGKVISDYFGIEFGPRQMRWFAVNAVYIKSLNLVMSFSTDLTELEAIEAELRTTQVKFRSVFEALPIGVSLLNAERIPVEVNSAMHELTGVPRERMNDEDRKRRNYFLPDGSAFAFEDFPFNQPGSEKESVSNLVLGTDVEGKRRWLNFSMKPMPEIRLTAAIVSDMTETIGFQRELESLNQTLEERVAARTQELDSLNSELESFSYSVSHDLRAPLTRIQGWINALAGDFRNRLGEKAVAYIARVRDEIGRMEAMIKATMSLARASSAPLHVSDVDLSGLAAEIIGDLRGEFPGRLILADIQPGLAAQGDRQLLELMLRNLLHNAVKFSAKKEPTEIRFGADSEAGEQAFFVRDNGAGFNPRFADKLFAPFQRLHSENEYPGTGVGLATVRRIIHRHGGHIRADSKPENGTTFFFTLSVKAEQ